MGQNLLLLLQVESRPIEALMLMCRTLSRDQTQARARLEQQVFEQEWANLAGSSEAGAKLFIRPRHQPQQRLYLQR